MAAGFSAPTTTPFLTDASKSVSRAWMHYLDDVGSYRIVGQGSPEGVVIAPIGTIYQRTDGGVGTSLYVKEQTSALATGWAAK